MNSTMPELFERTTDQNPQLSTSLLKLPSEFADVSEEKSRFLFFFYGLEAFVDAKTTDSSQRGRRFIAGNAGKAEGRTWL